MNKKVHKNPRTAIYSVFVLFLIAPLLSHAADIQWNGFASLTGGIGTDDATLTDGKEVYLYDYDQDLNFRPESKVALQAVSKLGDGFSITAQAISRGVDDFDFEMEWAFVTYDFGDASRVNVGKIRLPLFHYSDYLEVGHAYHWIRPPESVYDLFLSTVEGVNLQLNHYIGDWDSSVQIVFGSTEDELLISGSPSNSESKNVGGLAWSLGNSWLSFRATYFRGDITLQNEGVDEIAAGFTASGLGAFVDGFLADEDKGVFYGLSFKVDKQHWFVSGEHTKVTLDDSFIGEYVSSYLTSGLKFGNATFHLTYERQKDNGNEAFLNNLIGTVGLNALTGAAAFVVNSQEEESNTMTLGARYDVNSSVALKLDFSKRFFDSTENQEISTDPHTLRFSIDTIF